MELSREVSVSAVGGNWEALEALSWASDGVDADAWSGRGTHVPPSSQLCFSVVAFSAFGRFQLLVGIGR